MKKNSFYLFALMLCLNTFKGYCQLSTATDPGRGMYVNDFFKIQSATVVNQTQTLLGFQTKEIALLEYCRTNHITHIVLYDVAVVMDNAGLFYNGKTAQQHFCAFLQTAKDSYCITKIGVAGSSMSNFDDIVNINNFVPSPPIQVPSGFLNYLPFNPTLINQQYLPGDIDFETSEYLKLFIRATNMFGTSFCSSDNVDVFVIEYEYWNNVKTGDPCTYEYKQTRYPKFVQLLNYIDGLRNTYNNSGTHSNTIYTEVYLGLLDNFFVPYAPAPACTNTDPGTNDNHQLIANFIDGDYLGTGGGKRSDRLLIDYYSQTPVQLYKFYRADDYHNQRFIDFCNTSTSNLTDLHPMFSAESITLGAGEDFFGKWFVNPNLDVTIPIIKRNIFTAEKIYYDDWKADPNTIVRDAVKGNVVEPGGFQWFTSSYMVGPLSNPMIFTSNSPVCVDGGTGLGHVVFDYQGPLEKTITWTFTVGTCSSNGVTNAYDVLVPHIDLGSCDLSAGSYIATLTLNYPNGCSYTHTQEVDVVGAPEINIVGTSTACQGGSVSLMVSSVSGASYQWKFNGANTGTNSQYYSATQSGSYTCVISGGTGTCFGTTAVPVIITVNGFPTANITTSMSSGCQATLSTPSIIGATYLWSNGNTANSVITTSSGDFSVTVSLNGCSKTDNYHYQKFTESANVTHICFGGSTSSGKIDILVTDGSNPNPPYTYAWTPNVSTTATAINLSAGTYTCLVTDALGCTRSDTKTITQLTDVTPTFTVTNANCVNSSDGAVGVTLSGGLPPYSNYSWSSGQLILSISNVPAGNYTLMFDDDNNCHYSKNVTVNSNHPAVLPAITGNTTICSNQTATEIYQTQGGQTNYIWNVTGGPVIAGGQSTDNTITIDWGTGVSGHVTVNYTDLNGCSATIPTDLTVTINQAPSVTLAAFSAVCHNDASFALTGGSPVNGTYSGTGVSSGVFNPSAVSGGSSSVITYTVNGNGCTSSATSTITVNANPNVTLASFNPFCQSTTAVNLTGGSPAGGTYSGTNVSSNSFTPSIVGSTVITYTVTSSGCTSSSNSSITVNARPTVTLAAFTNVCQSTTAISLSGGSPTGGTYSGTNVNSGTGMFTPSSVGVTNITYTYSNGVCSNSATSSITVIQSVTPSVSFTSNPTSPICENTTVQFVVFSPQNQGTSPQYSWSTDNGTTWTSPSSLTTFQKNFSVIGTFQVLLRMTSNATCASPQIITSLPYTMEVTPFTKAGYDLVIKDNDFPDDAGLEPNPDNGAMWESDYIWTRRTAFPAGGVQEDPLYNPPALNYVFVQIWNRGCTDYSGTGADLHLYWAKASTGLSWPIYWDGTQTDPCLGTTVPISGVLQPQTIPYIHAKQFISTPMMFPWQVEDPTSYQPCYPADYRHFCLLGRIESVDDPIGVEVAHQYTNTQNYNNIAWKNLSVVNVALNSNSDECFSDHLVGGVVAVGNPFEDQDVYDFIFKTDETYSGKPITEQAEIKLTLDEKTWDKWVAGGSKKENLKIKREDCRQLVVTGNPAKLQNLSFDKQEHTALSLSFNFLTNEVDSTPQFDYHVIQTRNEDNSAIVGGEMYRIGKPNRYLFGANAGGDKDVSLKDSVQLQANNIGEAAFYNWYDLAGNLVFSGPTMTVAPDFTTKYKLEVIAVSDGFTSYDSVIVHVKEYEIINLNPNPTSGQLTVEYEARKATSGYFSIVQPYTAVSNNYMLDVTQTTTSLNLSGYTPGSYFVRLICDGQIRDEKTIIIIP